MSTTECNFLCQLSPRQWETTRALPFRTRYGEVEVPSGYITNLFTGVPNTPYPDFWKASVLHDYARDQVAKEVEGRIIKTRRQADIAFYDEMLVQSAIIFGKLQEFQPMDRAVEEFRFLLRTSWVYYRGVAGVIGSVYWWMVG
jgi:hypothetical protein